MYKGTFVPDKTEIEKMENPKGDGNNSGDSVLKSMLFFDRENGKPQRGRKQGTLHPLLFFHFLGNRENGKPQRGRKPIASYPIVVQVLK